MEKLYKQHKESDIFFIRHAQSSYETYVNILKSETPLAFIEPKKQAKNDLTEKGIIMAEKEATKFMANLNPNKNVLFFVASSENRAITTAGIYKKTAFEFGFEVVHQDNNKCAEECSDVRVLSSLSLKDVRPFIVSIFTPEKYQADINWSVINEEMKKKWEQARKIVLENDYCNWSDNFHNYADRIKEIFPELKTPLELFNIQFNNLQKLAVFARDKISKEDRTKSIKILAFGHEDYMGVALEKEFCDKDLGECEVILL